ncbi:MAG: hypothetical protein AB8C46_08745 [Burkholderiaceae bacterium]
MKSKIIDQVDPPENWLIAGALVLAGGARVLYTTHLRAGNVIEVFGSVRRTLDVTAAVDHRQLKHHSLFVFGEGFGLCDWNNSKLLLWHQIDSDMVEFAIRQSPDSSIEVSPRYVGLASYDSVNERLVLGINSNNGPAAVARYLTALSLPMDSVARPGADPGIEWCDARPLDLQHYPKTSLNHQPGSEWLGISALAVSDGTTYVHSKGGSLSRTKSGPEYEFSLLSALDDLGGAPRNLPVQEGNSSFSSDKQYFIQRPRSRKKLVFYKLENMSEAFDLSLKPEQNMANIDGKVMVGADINGDQMCIYSLQHANFCQLI